MLYIEIFYVRILFLYASTGFHFYHGPQRGTPGYLSPNTNFREAQAKIWVKSGGVSSNLRTLF